MPRLGTPGRGPRASTGTTRSEPPRRAASLPTSSRGGPRAPRRLRTGGRPGRGPAPASLLYGDGAGLAGLLARTWEGKLRVEGVPIESYRWTLEAVSYTHLTLPTIYSV